MFLLFSHAHESLFFDIRIYIDCFHCLGHLSHILLQIHVFITITSYHPVLKSSVGTLSIPGAFPLKTSFIALVTSLSDIHGFRVKSLFRNSSEIVLSRLDRSSVNPFHPALISPLPCLFLTVYILCVNVSVISLIAFHRPRLFP